MVKTQEILHLRFQQYHQCKSQFLQCNPMEIGFPQKMLPHAEDHHMLQNHVPPKYRSYSGEELSARHVPPSQRNNQSESGRRFAQYAGTSAGILEGIALKCGSKVEYRSTLCDTAELQFSVEVWIVGEKIGEGIGRTRREAQRQAANMSLRNLAEESRFMKMEENNSRKIGGSVAALKELCTVEGYNLVFQAHPSAPDGSVGKESYAQVEVGGQVLGKGVALTWEDAKLQAADEALGTLRSMLGQLGHKRSGSPRLLAPHLNKRFQPDFQRTMQRVPYGTYSRMEGHVP
nr:unnamed protein product [Digitaria exilis]